MRNALAVAASGLVVATFCSSVAAQQLPKSGSISVHSGYWAVGESVTVAGRLSKATATIEASRSTIKVQVRCTLALPIASTRFLPLPSAPK